MPTHGRCRRAEIRNGQLGQTPPKCRRRSLGLGRRTTGGRNDLKGHGLLFVLGCQGDLENGTAVAFSRLVARTLVGIG